MNRENRRHGLPFWPFVILDVLFLAMAVVIYKNAHRPFESIDAGLIIACVVGAAFCIALPFLRRDVAENAMAQAELVGNAVAEIKKLEAIAQQINSATTQWQGVQEHATKTVDTAREIAENMSTEAKAFVEFLKKANESEKSHLRLEVDKLRRAEGQWLEVLVRVMDNIYALHLAAVQSGKTNLINQIGQFQNSCFDVTRRIGLIPVVVEAGAAYDDKAHQLLDGEKATGGAKVGATIGCGYTFQGQVIRKPVVMLHAEKVKEEKGAAQDVLPGIAS